MKSLLFLLPVALLSNVGLRPAQGAFVHQAAAEFSDTVNTETSRWSFRFQTDATVHATHYPLLDQRIVTGRTYLPSRGDLSVWGLSGDPGAAWLGRQASGTVQTSGDPIQGLIFPSGEILARPGLNGLVVLTWLSPTTTVVNLQYRFADQEDAPACGNGIHWSIERGVELLAGGAFGPGGDTGVTNLANVVVHAGDRLHFIVAAAGDASCDATVIQATVSEPVDEAVYDAAADLLRDETLPGAQNGTNGVWIYGGYNPSLATFTPFSRAQHLDNWPATLQKGTFQGYSSVAGDGTPTLVVNTNRTVAQTPCCGITPIAPGQILMHPSSPGGGNFGDTYDVPTLRWTAPADGTAQVTANFLQRHGLAQRGHLLTNGMPALTGVASRDAGTTLSLTGLVVRTGDTIDVALAPGPSGYGSGSTETAATITFSALGIGRPIVIVTEPPDQTVEENRPAFFAVQVNNALAHFQWQRDGVDIPGANSSSYTLSSAPLAANQATFTCLMTNLVSTNLTRSARLTVLRDTSAPTISSVQNDGPQNLVVTFSEPIEPNSATNLANYTLDRGVTINAVNLGTDERSVILRTSPLLLELPSQLTVTGIRDLASVPNLIAPDTRFSFIPQGYLLEAIGNPKPAGSATATDGGYDLVSGGSDIGGRSDQFQMSYELRDGDFDLRVRIASLSPSDIWAKAGLMARGTLAASSAFAAVLASPTLGGAFFEARTTKDALATATGSFPVYYPSTWLRLQRLGNLFSGFASLDGEEWTALGSATVALPSVVYFGMVASSHNTNQTTLAKFRDLSPATGQPVATISLPREPLGPSSRRTGLILSEIMYAPPARADGRNLEFVELFNTLPYFEDLSGYRLSGDIEFEFASGTILPGGSFLVLAREPASVAEATGLAGIQGPYRNSLPRSDGTVRLLNASGAVLLEVRYEANPPWPVAAAGAGHSLVLDRPSLGERDPAAWAASDLIGGSPGFPETFRPEPLRAIRINEFLANPIAPAVEFIELFNASNQTLDLSGTILTDDPASPRFRLPQGTRLAPRGFVAFDQTQLNFLLNSDGEQLFLVHSNQTRVLDAVRFRGQAKGRSTGRFPDGAPQLRELSGASPGTLNLSPRAPEVVINELMYHPLSGNSEEEYLELLNPGSLPVDLSGWRITRGVQFRFPAPTVIPAGGYLVVARNQAWLLSHHPQLNQTNTLGDYEGNLANNGETVALERPDQPLSPDGTVPPTSAWIVVDEVTYKTGGRWGQWADGGGSSLERIDPRADPDQPSTWGDSDEAAKPAGWTTVEHTGVLDLGSTDHPANAVQVLLLGAGECLVDNVEVIANGVNRVANSTFEGGLTGWLLEGTHDASSLETGSGYESSRSLHLRATSHGGPVADRVRTRLTTTVAERSTATLRARVRWLRGHPEILVRLRGNWLEAVGNLAVPTNLGSPGMRNSRSLPNIGPAITEVTHRPILPAANQSVRVTARLLDPGGVSTAELRYRVDPSSTLVTLPMTDDGTGADPLAGDGIYSASIPGQASGALVAFQIQATDRVSPTARSTFPATAPAGECLVRFGEKQPFGNLGTYRLWMTRATQQRWSSRGNNSNQPLDCTFVNGDQRVIYNIGAYYSGSPFKTPGYDSPTGVGCDYSLKFPEDDPFLGATSFELSTPGNFPASPEPTALREQLSYWIARQLGLPYLERRFVHLFVNGSERGEIMEDTQVPNSDVVAQWFPDDADGELFKTSFSFEIDEATPSPLTWLPASLRLFTTTGGVKKTARYRWNWQPRAVATSANDYASLFRLVDAANAVSPFYTDAVESQIDPEQWMRFFAYEHIVGQWDSLGYNTGSNVFPYKGRNGRWNLLPWDVDISFVADGPTTDLFTAADPPLAKMNSHPPFRRAYWRALKDAVNGPLLDSRFGPVAAARHAALLANGLTVTPPDDATSYVRQRRAYIVSQLATAEAAFSITGPSQFTTNSNLATLTGTAPLDAVAILANGIRYRVTWTGVKTWSINLPLAPGTNIFDAQWANRLGVLMTNPPIRVTIEYNGAETSPVDVVVFNEIMHAPRVPDTEFVEILNSSATTGFDLSGWQVTPLGVTFPPGTLLAPRATLLLARDRDAIASTYGPEATVFSEFTGTLAPEGGELRLIKPGGMGMAEVVVDAAGYEAVDPWPREARGEGRSLQLIDATRDNRRVGNWSDGLGWRFFSVTGLPGSDAPRLSLWSDTGGEILIDRVALVPGREPEQGINLLRNASFEDPEFAPWKTNGNHSNSAPSSVASLAGTNCLRLVAVGPGSTNASVYQDLSGLDPSAPYTLSFWYLPNTGTNNLQYRLSASLRSTKALNLRPVLATPGALNSAAAPLPDFPTVWLSEVMPGNTAGLVDGSGKREPWIEIWNAGSETLSLQGLYLASGYSDLAQWAFPSDATLAPGEFRILFADGEPNQTIPAEWHTNFRLARGQGSVALVWRSASELRILDYFNYPQLPDDASYGSTGRADAFNRIPLPHPTPGAQNPNPAPALAPRINEWMASNTRTLANAANGGQYDDWLEIYNPNDVELDLTDYSLTDATDQPRQFVIPSGYPIPAHGFLLVWADGRPALNGAGRPELHVGFQLSRTGEQIALFDPAGKQVDHVTFGPQASDVSEGRRPDGGSEIGVTTRPSPGGSNTVPANHAPELAPLADRTLYLGETLRITVSGQDVDQPPQVLRYSLAQAPSGAVIDANQGVFNWTPSAPAAIGRHPVTVRVTDNGQPNLEASRTFQVTVVAPPSLEVSNRAGPMLSFAALAGRSYVVESKEVLDAPTWTVLEQVPAPGIDRTIVLNDSVPLSKQRFYRLVIVPRN